MIGLSLSFCVKDIISGKIDVDDVEKIITGTKIENGDHMEEVIEVYMKGYWENNPKAVAVVHTLWSSGRIDQPRTRGEEPRNLCDGHWLDENGNYVRL